MARELELIRYQSEIAPLANFANFQDRVVHFATDPEADPHRMLPCAIVTDHREGAVEIWWLHTEKNFLAAKEAREDGKFLFKHARNAQEAHCLVACPNGTYLTFFEKSSIGIRFDPKNGRAFLFDTLEVFWKDSGVESFGITSYANPDPEADFFYASCMRSRPDGKREVLDVRLAYDFSYWETVRSDVGDAELRLNAPHMTRISNGVVYDSHFKDVSYRVPSLGSGEISRHVLVDTGMRGIFRAFVKISGLPENEPFEKYASTEDGSVRFESETFRTFADKLREKLGCQHLNDLICEKILTGASLLPGKISYFDVADPKQVFTAATTKGSPAHFEFSKDGGRVYVSSHNFDIICDALRYFWPAAIDAYDVSEGRMAKTGTFEKPEWYRFTSHRVFENGGKEYLATVGQPNRLYVVDAASMKEISHADLADSLLDSVPPSKMDAWVRSTHTDERYPFFRPFEISEDGELAYVPNKRWITYVSLMKPGMPKKFVSFEISNPETASKFKKLTALNAHCYRIPR